MRVELYEALARVRALAGAHRGDAAVGLLDELAGAGESARYECIAQRAEVLLSVGRLDLADDAIEALRGIDPWRADLESGWVAYYRGAPAVSWSACARLVSGLAEREPRVRARAALLAGKLASDSGALDAARAWLVVALGCARQSLDGPSIAACAGALGEVFYLGGQGLAALDLIALDARMLAPGDAHVERLMVYRAHAYRQSQRVDAASSLYEEARQRARLRGHGEAYAVRGLLWCDAVQGGSVHALVERIDLLRSLAEPSSLALGLLAFAWRLAANGQATDAEGAVHEAATLLGSSGYRREAAWCGQLVGEADSDVAAEVPVLAGTTPALVCDEWMLELPLEDARVRRASALRAFRGTRPTDALAWMGTFF